MIKNRILFYSSVKDYKLFDITGFYNVDIKALKSVGYKVVCTNKISSFFCFWNYDISFLYFYKKSFFACLISFLFNKKIIFTGGIDELSEYANLSKFKLRIFEILFLLNYLLSKACNIVSLSDLENTTRLLKRFGINYPIKLKYFPHSIDFEVHTPFFQKENIFCTICWMGAIQNVKRKGVDKSIKIFNEFLKSNTDYKFYIIGTPGEGKIYLEELVNELGIQSNVIFTGSIDEINKLNILKRSKFYFQLSEYEGFGIAVIEAMLYENFIIHTGKGGMKDTIGTSGHLVEDFDSILMISIAINNINDNFISYSNELFLNRNLIKTKFTLNGRAKNFKLIINDNE